MNLKQNKTLIYLIIVVLYQINDFFLILWVWLKKAFVNHFTFGRYEHSSGCVLGIAIPKYLSPHCPQASLC